MTRNSTLNRIVLSLLVVSFLISCKKDESSFLTAPGIPDQSFVEEFDTVAMAWQRGWVPINNSNPKGSSIWQQGGTPQPIFPPYSSKGSYAGFIGVDYLSTSAGAGVISNWLISPPLWMQNGDKIAFYTRTQLLPDGTGDSTDWGNNLEVCINRKNDGTNVGVARNPRDAQFDQSTDRGDFEPLLSINPPIYNNGLDFYEYRTAHSTPALYDPLAYPAKWTRFEVTITGLSQPHRGRFAFRYYTLDGGSAGNATAVGIDNVIYTSTK